MDKYFYIIKFLFYNTNGKFRYSYIFPIVASIFGGYIIFMIHSIMTGMEGQIEHRINSFHYKYYTNNSYKDDYSFNDYANIGTSKIVYIDDNINNEFIYLFMFKNIERYINNKINDYLLKKVDNFSSNHILIGNELSVAMNLNINDTVLIYYPSNINIATLNIPSDEKVIGGIYDLNILNYDSNTIIGSLGEINDNVNYYFDVLDSSNDNYKENMVISNRILKALKLEKNIYYSFGFLIICIACFMIFQITIQLIKEKINQLSLLSIVGLSNIKMSIIFLAVNLTINNLMFIIGFILTNFTIYLNIKYNLFEYMYSALPFNVNFVNIFNFEVFILIILVNLIMIISSLIPIFILSKFDYVKF
tara:strand:+ start:1150 stop:2235 length:1086 start_codon:yes stop_codon:yes gene_type:complete